MTDSPDSPDLSRVLEVVRLLASRAVESEGSGRVGVAAQLYLETARSIQTALELGAEGGDLAEKAASYQQRAEQLRVSSAQAQLVSNVRGEGSYQFVSSSLTLVSSPGCG